MSKEVKIGLLGLVSCVMLYTGFNFLKGSDFFSRTKQYFVLYDNINGLTASNPVMLNGLNVGRVANIEILQKRKKMLVKLEIRSDIEIPLNSIAALGDNGLLGGKMIDLQMANVSGNNYKQNDTLKPLISQGMIGEITQKAEPLMKKTEKLMDSSNDILKTVADSKKEIAEMLQNFNQISASLKNTLARGEIDQILANTRTLTESLQKLTQQVNPLITKSNNLLDKMNALEIEKTITQANQAMSNINQSLSAINEGKGTIGALLKSDSLYQNMNKTLLDLDKIFLDLRENPKRYVNISVFPKKDKKEKK